MRTTQTAGSDLIATTRMRQQIYASRSCCQTGTRACAQSCTPPRKYKFSPLHRQCHDMCTIRLQAITVMAGKEKDNIQYWHDNGDGTGDWEASQPDISRFLMTGIVHESSTLYMSDDLSTDKHASVDSNYRVKGSGNVYATGASIFPTSGSWNRAC